MNFKKYIFYMDSEERSEFISLINASNSQRVLIFSPCLIIFMIIETIRDLSKAVAARNALKIVQLFSFINVDNHIFFAILDLLLIISSVFILILNFLYRKNVDRYKILFHRAIQSYGLFLLIISVLATLIDIYAGHSVDFTFYYYISIIFTSVFYIHPKIVVPGIVISNVVLWVLPNVNKWVTGYSPYMPYTIFILVALCICSIFRIHQLMLSMRREKKIKKFQEEAERQNQLKSLFLANMSHEIRTPMNAIMGMSELALDFDINDVQKNTIRQIRSSGTALLNIINDILDFSKIESGKMDIIPEEYDLFKMVYDAANVANIKLQGKDVKLIVEMDPELSALYYGDDLRLRQIIINLAGNASKFTQQGFVILRIEQLANYENRDGLHFSVIDSGCGIKDEDLGKLFNAFQQVDMKTNRKVEGTGLGLSISKRLVQLMNGSMGVKSEYGKGSCFYFNVPQEKRGNKTCAQAFSAIFEQAEVNKYHPELRNLPLEEYLNKPEFAGLYVDNSEENIFTCPEAKILVVDDNPVNLEVASGLLKKFSVNAETASSGFEALKKMENADYDLIFMDHQMPVMDGIETLEKLRDWEKENGKENIVVALSANAVNGAKAMFIDKGFNDFLAKPVQRKDFGECLKKWLNSRLIIYNSSETLDESENNIYVPENFIIPDSSKINFTEGLNNTGNFDSWIKAVKLFVKVIPEKSELILSNSVDVTKDFVIEVHALKSSARIIGALELSRMAKELEQSGNDYNSEAIKNDKIKAELIRNDIQQKTAVMLKLYREYSEILKTTAEFNNIDKENTEASEDEIKMLLDKIAKAAEDFDLTSADDCINELKKKKLSKDMETHVAELADAVENIDFEEVQNILGKF